MVRLGSSSKPATVSIGGSSGKTTTTPAKSSSSTSSTPAPQAKAPAPAPAPAYINPYDKPISQTPAAQQVIKPTPPPAEYELPSTPPPAPAPAYINPYDKPISQTPAAQQVIKPTPPPAEYRLEPPVVNIYNPATGLLEEQPRAPLYGQTPYDKPISQTPAAQRVIKPTPPPAEYNLPSTPPPAPTPAQAIQQSIASGTNVPISAQTLAARNQGLKPLTPTSQLQKALLDAMNREIESLRASGTISTPRVSAPTPTPAQAIQQSIASGTNVPISAQTLAARNQGLKPLTPAVPSVPTSTPAQAIQKSIASGVNVPATAGDLISRNKGLKPIESTTPVTGLASEVLGSQAPKVTSVSEAIARAPIPQVAKVVEDVAKKVGNFSNVISTTIEPPASLDMSNKMQMALASSLATGNTASLQSAISRILDSADRLAEAASSVADKKIDTEKASLYALSSSAFNNLVKVANNEFNKANDVKTASDIKAGVDRTITGITEIGKYADQAADLAKMQKYEAIIGKVNENHEKADQALKAATIVNSIKINPGQSQESAIREIYSKLYGDAPASSGVVIERMGAIKEVLDPYTKDGKVDYTKAAAIRQALLPHTELDDWSKTTTGDDMEDQRRGIGKYASKSETKSTAATSAKPGTATQTSTKTKTGPAETKKIDTRTGGIFESLDKVLSKDRDEAFKKLYDLGATTTSKTTTSSKPAEGLDFNKLYRTPTGDVLPGSKISKVEFAKGGFTEYAKTVPETAKPATTSTSKPKDAVAVKGSVEGRVVNVDPDVYKALKSTGYKDNQIADSLASGKMGIYVSNDGKVKIAMQRSVPNAAMSDSGLFSVEPFKTVKDSTGKDVPVNEWAYRKTAYLGLSDTEIGDLGQDLLNRAATLDVGTAKKPETGLVSSILTLKDTVLQVPDMRLADSGMFTLKPLTNAQVPDPLKDKWGYADWVTKLPYMAMMGPGYENGYEVQPTVQGLIQLDKIAKDLAKPGATLKDVPTVGKINQYEVFKNALTYADSETVAEIAKNNPRAILGAATDVVMQPILESKLGSAEYKKTLENAMTSDEKRYVEGMESERGFGTALAYLPTSEAGTELMDYSSAQVLALAEAVVTEPLTPNETWNAALFLPLTVGIGVPLKLVSKASKTIEGVKLLKAADGTVGAYRGTEFIGKVGSAIDNPNVIRLETIDGKIFEISRDGKEAAEVDAIAKTVTTGEKAIEGKTIIPVASTDTTKLPTISATVPGIGIKVADVNGGLLTIPTDAKAAAGVDTSKLTRSVTGEPITAETLAARNEGLKPIGAISEKTKTISFTGTKTDAATETKFFDMKKNVIVDDGFKPFSVVDPTGNKFTITKVRETGVMETADGKYLVDIDGKGNYYQVHKDYVPANKVVLTTDEYGNPAITKVSRPGSVDTWQVTYTDDFGEVHNVVTTRKITTNDDALELAVEWDARLKALPDQYQPTGSHAPTSVSDEMLGGPDGYGGEMGDAGPIGGGGGGYTGGGAAVGGGTDTGQWAYNADWGTELRYQNGAWQALDRETGRILSIDEYEKLLEERTATKFKEQTKVTGGATEDTTGWKYYDDWGTELRTPDGGKTWEVKDRETGGIFSLEDYENLLRQRAAEKVQKPTTGKEVVTGQGEGQWVYNRDWGAELRYQDGVWQVKDPDTGRILSTEDYEKLLAERTTERYPTHVDDVTGGKIIAGDDASQWTYNQNWGAELRSLDNGKTWQVKDPETGNILTTTEYEELVLARTAERSPKYDAALNTYTKLNEDGSKVYQNRSGRWVSKEELDAERAVIADNTPNYDYNYDDTEDTYVRTNPTTGNTDYMDTDTGNWLPGDQYTEIKGSGETPIWDSEGGFYFFRKDDGTFEILNPYTNARQTPEEYGKYLADRLAATTPTTPATPTITTPAEYYTPSPATYAPTEYYPSPAAAYTPSNIAPTQSELSKLYDDMIAAAASKEEGAEAVADAWTRFTKTEDFGKFVESGDASLLAKAKNGDVLTESEIDRVQYLRSQMSDAAGSTFDEAMGTVPINTMPLSEFQNQITAARDSVKNLSNADIKASNLGPEKELIVHQTKAEANMDDFFQFEEFKGASDVILDEMRYYLGEPTTTPGLLGKFSAVKATWTAKATMAWDKIVEALKSAKNLISQMPASWLDANEDYSMAELILGNSKYSDILLVTGTKGPTKASMAKAFEKAANEGTTITGSNGWQAATHNFKKSGGWVVKSPEGDFQFIRRNEMVPSADEAMNVAATPAKMFYWEKPSNVPTEFKVPENANGSRIVAVNRADPYSVDESIWKGLTESGGLTSDMSKEFVKIDLLTDDGILWSTVREADKAGPFQIGRTVEIVEKDAVRINGLSGIDLQRMNAREFASLVGDSDIQAAIRAIPGEDIQHLTKYLDETRVKMIEDARTSTPRIVEAVPPETPTIRTPETTPGPEAVTPEELASEYQKAQQLVDAKTTERIAIEDELSELGRQIQELGVKLETAPVKEKAAIKSQIDGLKTRADALKNKGRRLNQEVYDARNVKQAKGTQIVNGQTTVDDLLNQLDGLSVRDGRSALDEALAKSEDLKTYLRNTSREEAEQLAMSISEKLGSDRSAAEKIMGFHYQGAVGRIDDVTRAKMSATDQEYIRRAMTRQLNQNDYQQVTRIVENAGAYQGVSVGADLGRLKIDNILDSSMAGKTDELKKLLTDKDVRAALKDEAFADEAFGKIYDVDPSVASQYQKAAQDRIISDMKADPKYNNLSAGDKKFIDEFYSKRIYTREDMERLARIRQSMPSSKFSRFLRGGAIGSKTMIRNMIDHPLSTLTTAAKRTFKAVALVYGFQFLYFAVEEGFQTVIQMTGWNTPTDEYMEYMSNNGIPWYEGSDKILEPFNWVLDHVPYSDVIFGVAAGFRWYIENAAVGQMENKVSVGIRSGLWVPDEGCKFGPGCWGHIRPESERPAYWAQHPETMAHLDGDTLRRIYDIQGDGSIGPNNLIAKGLGITDPELAKQVGLGHFISASNQGAKDTLTKEFGGAYDLLVKGGAISELANKAYLEAKGQTSTMTIDPNAQYIDQTGKVILGKDVTDPSQIIGQVMADGTVRQFSTIGSTTPGMTAEEVTAQQRAVLAIAPTSMEALTKYATYGGTATAADAQTWRSIFISPDGSLDVSKLKSMYPDMTAAQMSAIFPKEAINKAIQNDLASATDPVELSRKIAEYKASGMIAESARIEQYMPADQAAIFTARQNNPANFKATASGNTLSWIDDTRYPHTANIIQSGKLFNPTTGQYDIDQKKTESDGSEFTIDTGKYAEFINSGSKDIAAFLADKENYIQTWKGTGSTSKTSSGGGGGGGGGSSSYPSKKSTTPSEPKVSGLFIDTAGLNAEVYEDGKFIGMTDEILNLEPGVHTITIKKDGYKPYTMPVQIYNGSIARKSATLYQDTSATKKTGEADETGLFIDSDGLNAEIYEDGKLIGTTDEKIKLEPGPHTITMKKEGYKPYTTTVQVYDGYVAQKTATLYKDTSPTQKVETAEETGLFVDTGGLGAEIYEDGKLIGTADETIKLEPGTHTITMQKKGYKPYTFSVTVYDGHVYRKTATLYPDKSTTKTGTTATTITSRVEKFVDAVGGEEAITPDHIVYAYAIAKNKPDLAESARSESSPPIAGNWTFAEDDVKELISLYRGS